jgi:hypothetical protein
MLDKKLNEYVTRVENDAYELGISVGKHQERERIYQQILDIDLEGDYSDDLVLVIRAVVARALVSERRKIIKRLGDLAYFDEDGHEMISEFKNDLIALI